MSFQTNSNQHQHAQHPLPSLSLPQNIPSRSQPSLRRIHADNQDKKSMCIFWGFLLILLIVIAIIANLALPNAYRMNSKLQQLGTNNQPCLTPILSGGVIICGNFPNSAMQLADVLAYIQPANQFGLVYLDVIPSNLNLPLSLNQQMNISLYEISITATVNHTIQISPLKLSSSILSNLSLQSSTAKLLYDKTDPNKQIGYTQLIATFNKITDSTPVLITVTFSNSTQFSPLSTAYLSTNLVNEQFTFFAIIIRGVFLGLAIIAATLYLWRFVRIPVGEKILEQKFIAVLSILLLMFNDPFYAITVLKPNGASSFFSIFFIINLIAFLFLKWITMVDRIQFEDGQRESEMLTKKKIAYVVILEIELITLYMLYAMFQINDRPLLVDDDYNQFNVAAIIASLTGFAGFVYIIFRYIRICMSEGSKMWRNQLYLFLSLFFILAMALLLYTDSFTIFNYSGQRIFLVYTFFNFYVFYLQYMYTITREENYILKQGNDENGGNEGITVGSIDMVDINLQEEPSDVNQKRREERVELVENSQIETEGKEDQHVKEHFGEEPSQNTYEIE